MTTVTNHYGLPTAIVTAVQADPYRGGGDISATRLIDAPQVVQLARIHREALTVDAADRIWSLLGQAVHTVLERAGLRDPESVVEQRLYAEVNGWQVSGQFDVMDLSRKALVDYKVTTVFKADGSDSWVRQLNILRWLAHKNGHEINTLEIVAILRDWRKAEAQRNSKYPQAPVAVISVPVWSLEETEQYITERVTLHQAAAKGSVIPCTDEERWKEPDRWAIIKPGAKRALQVLDNEPSPSAVTYGYVVERRPGTSKRCAHYCDVSAFCPQWAELRGVEGA